MEPCSALAVNSCPAYGNKISRKVKDAALHAAPILVFENFYTVFYDIYVIAE
jgi:hypothetical protein